MDNRLTMHKGYRNALGKAYNSKHNDREEFAKDYDDSENAYWNFVGNKSFSEDEKGFYRKYFGEHVKKQNAKYKAKGQYGYMTTISKYKEAHPPEETLLYIGRHNVNPDDLVAVFQEFDAWQISHCWRPDVGGVQMLNAGLHLDEKTPHIQFRQVYMYKGKDGEWQVSQNKALDILGYQRPDMSKPVSRHNNAKMTFTAQCRQVLFEIAAEHGIELIEEPLPKDEVGLPLKEFIQREKAREAAAAEQKEMQETIEALQDDKSSLEQDIVLLQEGIDALQDDKFVLEQDIEELQEDKKDVSETLQRLRSTTAKEQEYREKKRKEAEDEGYKKGLLIGINEGAQSATGRVNEIMRRRAAEEQEEEKREDAATPYDLLGGIHK